ncbi:hypothetical protein [Absidia glauca]|uniref:Uncharacterized protein n=1 Tax=Absidia glauca TaxID=4829 RepID=A0A163M2G5_ABSGL|nr:hypothetical protein [Absidia glauca]
MQKAKVSNARSGVQRRSEEKDKERINAICSGHHGGLKYISYVQFPSIEDKTLAFVSVHRLLSQPLVEGIRDIEIKLPEIKPSCFDTATAIYVDYAMGLYSNSLLGQPGTALRSRETIIRLLDMRLWIKTSSKTTIQQKKSGGKCRRDHFLNLDNLGGFDFKSDIESPEGAVAIKGYTTFKIPFYHRVTGGNRHTKGLSASDLMYPTSQFVDRTASLMEGKTYSARLELTLNYTLAALKDDNLKSMMNTALVKYAGFLPTKQVTTLLKLRSKAIRLAAINVFQQDQNRYQAPQLSHVAFLASLSSGLLSRPSDISWFRAIHVKESLSKCYSSNLLLLLYQIQEPGSGALRSLTSFDNKQLASIFNKSAVESMRPPQGTPAAPLEIQVTCSLERTFGFRVSQYQNMSFNVLFKDKKFPILQQYNSILEEHRWTLSTGTVVSDQMKQLVTDSVYEHPVHSMIIDPDDTIWKNYFSPAELKEIRTQELKPLGQLPQDLTECIDLYDQEWSTAIDLYQFADDQKHHPVNEIDKKWVRESIMRAAELFFHNDTLDLNDHSESDLLHGVWQFVYRAFQNQGIKAKLGERCSVAVALGRNEDRALEVVERRVRKAMGAKVDILFKAGNDEVGTCEVGKDKVCITDDKYLDDGLIKLPKTLKDMLAVLIQKNPAKINDLFSVGFLMMGLSMELVVMDCPVGRSIARVSRTQKL